MVILYLLSVLEAHYLFKFQLQSSDISEMSLLSDFTMDYNQDPILMTNVETTVTVLDGNNPSEKIQLTPSQSEASLLVESPEACTVSISKHLYLSQTSPQIEYVSDEAAGEGDSSCMETTYLDCLLQSEQQTSNDQQMWPTFKEACQTRSASFSSLPDFNIDQSNSSIEFSEGYLKVAGLTNINLEELVDTASILLAVRDAENDETENICEAEKQARRKDFYKVMKGERRVKIHHCREPEKRLRGLVCCFDTDLIMKEIEFITDFIYCKYECPAVVQKFIQYNFWQNRLNCGKASMTAIHKFKKSRNNSRGTSLTHEVARCNTRLISAKRNNYIYSNPPVEEISRTVSHQHIRRTSLETNPHSLEPHPHSKKLHPLIDLRETLPKRTDNEEIEESLEVWKSNNENSFNSQDSCEWENWKSESSIDLFDRQFFNDDQPKDGVKQWLTLSEWWLSESLDVNEMLQLVDQQ